MRSVNRGYVVLVLLLMLQSPANPGRFNRHDPILTNIPKFPDANLGYTSNGH
jgi:hypothetical protein